MAADPERTWTIKQDIDSDIKMGEGESYPATSSNRIDWLQDETMLPSILPNARIMRYGYQSDGFGRDGSGSVRVAEVAQTLLKLLQEEREEEVTESL
jgi:hypothetical protein